MKTVGRTTIGEYEAALREINNPISEDYIINPDSTMSCDQLVYGINFLTARIQLWTNRLNSLTYKLFSGDKTTAQNISSILQVENQRLQLYQQAHQIKCLNVQPVEVLAPVDPVVEQIQSNGGSGSMVLPLLLLAGGIWFISRKKRRSQRKRTNRKR
jgi:hypothetical protein